jgi:hypothetical protein
LLILRRSLITNAWLFVLRCSWLRLVQEEVKLIPNAIQVQLSDKKPPRLHVTLRSFSASRITLNTLHLPRATRYSMVLVPVKPDGQCLGKYYPVEDLPVRRISLEPHGSLSGDIDLQSFLPGLEEVLKKSEIHLFWAYEAPEELQSTRWSGGWIFLPRTK